MVLLMPQGYSLLTYVEVPTVVIIARAQFLPTTICVLSEADDGNPALHSCTVLYSSQPGSPPASQPASQAACLSTASLYSQTIDN